jgi:hypothetical protein
VHVPLEPELIFVLFGKGGGSLASDLTRSSLLTYAVTYFRRFPYSFGYSFIGVILLLGRDGFHISFQGSRGGNDTRLHCLGTVEISGLCFVLFCFSRLHLGFVLLGFFFLYIGFIGGMGDTRYSLLPCHGMWLVGFGCERNHGMRSCFLFEIDILGVFLVGES